VVVLAVLVPLLVGLAAAYQVLDEVTGGPEANFAGAPTASSWSTPRLTPARTVPVVVPARLSDPDGVLGTQTDDAEALLGKMSVPVYLLIAEGLFDENDFGDAGDAFLDRNGLTDQQAVVLLVSPDGAGWVATYSTGWPSEVLDRATQAFSGDGPIGTRVLTILRSLSSLDRQGRPTAAGSADLTFTGDIEGRAAELTYIWCDLASNEIDVVVRLDATPTRYVGIELTTTPADYYAELADFSSSQTGTATWNGDSDWSQTYVWPNVAQWGEDWTTGQVSLVDRTVTLDQAVFTTWHPEGRPYATVSGSVTCP